MKRFLLLIALSSVSLNAISQNEFTGDGDGYSWSDPFNWSYFDVPQSGDDIVIDGFDVFYDNYSFDAFGSLELINYAYLFMQGDIYLQGDFTVDVTSSVELYINEITIYDKIICDGNYYFNGSMVINMPGFGPQIGDSFQIIEGYQGSCGTATTLFVPESQTSGIEVTFAVECEEDGVYYTVTGVNYASAKAWDGEGGNNLWTTAANWDPNGVPTVNDIVYVNLPATGGVASTSGAGVTAAKEIIVGNNNTLIINGDLSMYSLINNNIGGTVIWNAGEISKQDINVQSLLINYGDLILDSPGLKEMEDDFEIWAFQSDINHNQGNLNINNGKIRVFNRVNYNINGDNITIGHASGSNHSLSIGGAATLSKTSGNGISLINLTDFVNNGTVESNQGTLSISDNYDSESTGTLSGSASIALPIGLIEGGNISPGNSPGVLTFVKNLNTNANANFNIEINGSNPGTQYDQIIVEDNAILNGTINVDLGYLPADDAIFEVLTAGNIVQCNFPAQVTGNYNGTNFTFDVVCQNNILYLNGPNAILSTPDFDASELEIYPNPVSDMLTIKLSRQVKGKWMMHNILGQEVLKGNLSGLETDIDTSTLQSGLYALQIKDDGNNTVKVKKIIVTN